MKTLLTITTLLLTVMFPSISFAEWTKVGENNLGNRIYFDLERIRKHDGHVYFWSMNDYLKPDNLGNFSVKIYRQVDCNVFRSKILIFTFHREPMGVDTGETSEPIEMKNWEYPQPNSILELILNEVCKK